MGNINSPGLRRFGRIANVLAWTGAAGGAYGGWTLATMGIHGVFGGIVGIGAAALGVVSGAVTGIVLAIPVAIGASVAINVAKKSLGLGKKPPQPAPAVVVAPQPVVQSVKDGLQEMKSAAEEFNAEAAVELADNLTFRKLKLTTRRKPETENTL